MKIKKILTESGLIKDNTFTSQVDHLSIDARGLYQGQTITDANGCTFQWELNYEAKIWGIKNLDIYVKSATLSFNTESESDIELELTRDNCEFISKVDISSNSNILIQSCIIFFKKDGSITLEYF